MYQVLYVNLEKESEKFNERKKDLVERLGYLVEVVKERGEKDNITVVACII